MAYLDGEVDTFREKAMGETVASQTAGVVAVMNRLDVTDVTAQTFSPYVDTWSIYDLAWYGSEPTHTYRLDRAIRQDIERDVWWSRYVDSDEVSVVVDDGTATLIGVVDSWAERAAARENAFEGGALSVINKVNVVTEDAS